MPCKEAKQFTEADIPDLAGYTVIVTGATGGIGGPTADQLARHNARVYITGRSSEKIARKIAELQAEAGEKQLDLHALRMDLEDLKSVQRAAEEFMSKEDRLDILINNAGVSFCART
jgi:retinol dehydrogenase 12